MMDEAMQALVAALGDVPPVSAIYGEPVRKDDVTVIPVARSRRRVRGGKHSGAVLDTVPVGCIELRSKGARFVPIRSAGAAGILSVIGATIVLCLGIVGWAWGRPSKSGRSDHDPCD